MRSLLLQERFSNSEVDLILRFSALEDPLKMRLATLHQERIEQRMGPIGIENNITADSKQKTVLVDVIKFVDFPKEIVPSTIRPRSVDGFFSLCRHTLYLSSLFAFIRSESLKDGKHVLTVGVPAFARTS
jgi:hypothetical protein